MKAIASMLLAGTAAVVAGAYGLQNVRADDHEYVPKAVATPLVQAPLSGAPGQIAVIKHFEMEPGWIGGRHFHTGDVFVYVVEGSIVFTLDGTAPMTLEAGDTLHELPNQVMSAANASSTEQLKIIVFQVNDDDTPLMIKAD